jgi:hydrogenase maturation protease
MNIPTNPRVAVVGLSGTHHHDDNVGVIVARRLQEQSSNGLCVVEIEGNALELEDIMKDYDWVILVDSSFAGGEPGRIYRLESQERPGYADWFPYFSTHTPWLCESVNLATTMGEMPSRLLLFGVEGKDYSEGDGLSPEVEHSIDEVVGQLLAEIATAA